jgi:hypothetical protein
LLINVFPSEKKSFENLQPLERYQLKYLFENTKLKNITKNSDININLSYFFISYGLINTLSRKEIKNLSDKLNEFKNSNDLKPSIYILVLGILNHWVNINIL